MDNIFFVVLCEENERVSFAAIFYGGDSRAATRAIGRAESTRELRANPWRTPRRQRVVRAHFLCAQQRFAHAGAPTHPGRAVRGRGGDSDAAAAPCAQEHFVFDFGD